MTFITILPCLHRRDGTFAGNTTDGMGRHITFMKLVNAAAALKAAGAGAIAWEEALAVRLDARAGRPHDTTSTEMDSR
jgi:hypothetical protein